jgi:hypothetical protein
VIDRIGAVSDGEEFDAEYVESWINCTESLCMTAIKEAMGFYLAVHTMIERGMVRGVK